MKNKFIIIIAAAIPLGIVPLAAQTPLPLPTPPEWKVTLRAVDESGKPVSDAQAEVESIKPSTSGEAVRSDGKTDTDGLFTATGHSWVRLYLHMAKSGFYSATKLYDLNMNAKVRYEPWDPTFDLLLKKIGKPIPMYAKSVNLRMPVFEQPVGFDLTTGDWVGPYGKGINADILFTGHFDKYTNGESDYMLTVSFPKTGDGIQEFTVPDAEKGSSLRSPHKAPTDGYQSHWVQFDNRKPKTPIKTNRNLNRNYFFRVRTVMDERGNIVSAHYGKIYGDFMQFSYYLNPTPNDRNVEFDPKQNLLKNLKSDEGVSAP